MQNISLGDLPARYIIHARLYKRVGVCALFFLFFFLLKFFFFFLLRHIWKLFGSIH